MTSHPYSDLTPEKVMDAIETLGYICDARVFPLNSYENRVYQVGIEEEQPLIAKFYRPGRWSKECIHEEHNFLLELQQQELPVIAPIVVNDTSLFEYSGFYFAIFKRQGGHAPELSSDDDLELLGRWLGQLHNIGSSRSFIHRPTIRGADDLVLAEQQVLSSDLMPPDYNPAYTSLMADLTKELQQRYQPDSFASLRLHGDLHTGNLLLRNEELYMVDFDDCLQGPAMQDIWMLLSGERHEQQQQLMTIAEGYEMFRQFPSQELQLVEALRTLRIARYAAWLCQRWQDPAFPQAFPWLESHQFWSQHILSLREQLAALREPAIELIRFN